MKKLACAVATIAICVVIVATAEINFLTVHEVGNEKAIYMEKVSENDTFMVKWIHSVELEPWEEHFRVGEDMEMYLEKTRFKAFGAGVPDSAGTSTDVRDGYVVFDGINKRIPDLVYGISPIAKHILVVGDETLPLYEILPPDTAVSFRIEKIRLWEYLFYNFNKQIK